VPQNVCAAIVGGAPGIKEESQNMQQSRRRTLIKAVQQAALELARTEGARQNQMLAISDLTIFERVRLTIPNVTLEEVQDAIMQSLPYMGGRRQ
jgi:hypothetical protein